MTVDENREFYCDFQEICVMCKQEVRIHTFVKQLLLRNSIWLTFVIRARACFYVVNHYLVIVSYSHTS